MAPKKRNILLSEDDLLFVDSLLAKYKANFLNCTMLHGFFAGLICAPTLIMPNRYLPIVWGQNSDLTFVSMEEVIRFHSTCSKLWNLIADNLYNKTPRIFPIPVGDTHTLLDWLMGFQYATECTPSD
jgi:yecA family protein